MRLFLLPISTRRTLIYCERPKPLPGASQSIVDKAIRRAEDTWTSWEKAEKGWKKTVTGWGNVILRRIPFEEWGLKTVPALSNAQLKAFKSGQKPDLVEVHFPGEFLHQARAPAVFEAIATERQGLHRQRMIGSMIAAPLTLPFALIPIIPNFPGLYMVFRAYSHWRAWRGSQHLEWIVNNKLVSYRPSKILDELYASGLKFPSRKAVDAAASPTAEECKEVAEDTLNQPANAGKEIVLLKNWSGNMIAEGLKLPDMQIEIERAVEQVEAKITKDQQTASSSQSPSEKSKDKLN